MSWYNEDADNNFIDATQEFTGGGGGTISTSISQVTNTQELVITETTPDTEETTTIGNVLLPAVFNTQTGTFDLYIRNTNNGGKIFITTKGDGEQIKVDDGKLFVYYYYNPGISLIIPSGWTNVANYLVANRQGINNNSAALVVVGAAIVDLETKTTTLGLGAITLGEVQASINGRVTVLEGRSFEDPRATSMILAGGTERGLIARVETSLYNAFLAGAFVPRNAANIMRLAKIKRNVILGVLTSIAFGGTLTAVIGLVEYIIDIVAKSGEEDVLNNLVSSRVAIDGQTDKNDVDKIYISGLQIASATNAGMTDGTYEIVIDEDIELAIEIKVTNGIAQITDLIGTTTEYSIGDVINIDKTELGGSSGTLDIDVNQLYSMIEILDFEILKSQNNLKNIDGRQRRRQFIPDKDNFGNGINITETNITEPSGEITKDLDISLKIDTSQFTYDASGNLQLNNFGNIGNTGNLGIPSDATAIPPVLATGLNLAVETNTGNISTNTGNIGTLQTNVGVASSIIPAVVATGLNLDVETLRAEVGDNVSIPKTGIHKSIDDIIALLGTIPDYDQNGNVVDLATGIYARIDNIYKVVMEEGFTFDNNTDYKLSLGYDTVWNGFHYNLFCIALKSIRTGAFSSSFYGNDFMGLFPSLERVSDKTTEYLIVKDVGIELLTNFQIKKGLLYFDNVNPLIDFNLARKVEYVIFLTPKNIDNLNVEYNILQTGVELAPNQYDIDLNKLKLSIINNKLNLTNYIYYNTYYYQSLNTTLFNTYMLATFASNGSFNQSTATGFKEAVNTIAGREHYIGLKSIQISPTTVPNDQTWYDIVRSSGAQSSSYYYWHFDILRDMTYQPQSWASPVFYYKENLPLPANRNNFSKIKIRYDMENFTTGSGWSSAAFGSQNAIDTSLEFKMKITRKQYDDPFNTFGSILVDFNQTTKQAGQIWYEMDIWINNNSPVASSTKYNWVELELVHKGGSFTPLPSGVQSYTNYNSQHRIKVYTFGVYEYDTLQTDIPGWKLHTFQDDVNDFFPTPIQATTPHKAVVNLDLPNKLINYYVDDVGKALTLPSEITITGTAFANEDPNQNTHPASFVFANNTHTSLTLDNNILIIGNDPSSGELNYSHFNWKFIANGGTEDFMTLSQRNKLDELITYNYYYETVSIPRYLKTKELYADVFDARKILINGGALYDDLTPAEQLLSLRSSDQSSDDLQIGNAFVPIDKLFVRNPTQDGFLNYNFTNKEFSISSSTVSSGDVEIAVGGLVKTTPSTYGFIFNQTDPADKYLQIDDTYINSLINLVLQNQISISNAFVDFVFSDTLIEVQDASSYSPYTLREVPDTDIKYNYVINGNHQYLYREIDMIPQYHPTLGIAFGDLNPIVDYQFIGQIINNAPNAYGYTASDYDLQQTVGAGQVVYGVAFNNKKGQPGVTGGTTELISANTHIFSSGGAGCISFFHKPFGSNTNADNHTILEIKDGSGNNLIYFTIEYVSNVAEYHMYIIDQTNNANVINTTFNNSDSEIYFGNENNLLVWFEFPNYNWYINGKHHGSIINPGFSPVQGIINVKLNFNLSNYNNKSLLYEVKVYPRQLFLTGGSSSDELFNVRRVADITQQVRIVPFTSGAFTIKEASGIQETKARSISNKRRVLTLETSGVGGSSYTDADVKILLANMGGTNITWNIANEQFDNDIVAFTSADAVTAVSGLAGTGMSWNVGTQKLDCTITDIVSISNGDINIDPDGTGNFVIKGNSTSGSGSITLNCENNSHGVKIKAPPHSASATYTLTLPNTDGSIDQVLKTDGSGNLDWVNQSTSSYGNSDVVSLLTTNHITFNPNYIQFDDNIRVNDNKILKYGSADLYGVETVFNSTNNKLECSCKNGSGVVEIRKIIISGISGTTAQVADLREFEFFGLTGGYANGDRRSIITATTNLNTSQYPFTPVVTPQEWVSGGNEIYAYNGVDNSLYLVGTQQVLGKLFSFEFTGGNYPPASSLTGVRIFWDRPTWTGSSGSQGVWSLIIEDQNGIQHTMITSFSLLQNQGVTNSQYAYIDVGFGNIVYPSGTPAVSDVYDITTQDGKINIKQELSLSANGIKFSDGSLLTTAPSTGAVYPLNVANTGLPLSNGGIDLFEKDLWFNSSDNKNRLYFVNVGDTIIRCPANAGNPDILLQVGTTNKMQVNTAFVRLEVPLQFSDNTQLNTIPTLPSLIANNLYELEDVKCIYFTDPLAFIKGDKLTLRGISSGGGGSGNATEVEDFTNASGSTTAIMTGFNTNLFDNGSAGSGNVISGSSAPNNLGQISGIYGSVVSGVRNSGGGTGSSGNFNCTNTGHSKYFLTAGGANRSLRTKNIQSILSTCTTITFWYIAGNQSNGGNYPETNESFYIEFLSQYGNPLSSALIHAGGSNYAGGSNFNFYIHTMTTAQQGCYYVRWIQYNTSSGNYDHYGLADITFNYVGSAPPTTSDIDVRLENLPSSAPSESNRMWKDSSGYLRIT